MTTIAQPEVPGRVVGGVDTHQDRHVAAALDHIGRLLGVAEFPATRSGYEHLHSWLAGHGEISAVGVEGCGSWGAGLARHLGSVDVVVVEVNRPNRQTRRRRGKSDSLDAEAAARAVLNGPGSASSQGRRSSWVCAPACAWMGSRAVELTAREYALLEVFLRHPD